MKRRKVWITFVLCLFLFKIYMFWTKTKLTKSSLQTDDERRINKETGAQKEWKTVVFWTAYSSDRNLWKNVFQRHMLGECEEERCHLIFDPARIPEADAVMFNGCNLKRSTAHSPLLLYEPPPEPRNPRQIFIFFTMEPPPKFELVQLENYHNFFNWTMSYRKDSDVVVPYGKIHKRKDKRTIEYLSDEELRKKELAIWMVSHCETQSRRELLVSHLKEHLSVKQYGLCGKKKCGQPTTIPKLEKMKDDPCQDLISKYAFYLALESSLCEDYITEKFYRTLKLGLVPVTYGAVNYSQFAPPDSFIDVRDFNGTEDLAKFLKGVATNANSYNKFLKWQEDYEVDVGSPYKPHICDLCKKLHEQTPNSPRKTYQSIEDWFIRNGTCHQHTIN